MHRLFKLGAILPISEIRSSSAQDVNGDPVSYVIKRGAVTKTTIGRMTGFVSRVRHDIAPDEKLDTFEVAIYPQHNNSGSFSAKEDLGSLIAGPQAEFIALLTSGAGVTDSSDITYGTPMSWLWNEVINPQFPGANLYFDISDY